MANLHMRIDGVSRDIELESLNISLNSSDAEVREAVARFLDKPQTFVQSFVIARTSTTITLRPEAMFGS